MSLEGKREAILTVVVGAKGRGKTYETIKEIKEYKRVLNRKVLILDVNQEYTEFAPISCDPKSLKLFSMQPEVQIRRVMPVSKGKPKTLAELKADMVTILDNFRGGMTVFEDINKIVGDAVGSELIGQIVTQRHRNQDMLLQFQGLSRSGHPKILMNTNLLRYHFVEDSVERSKNKFTDKEQILKIAEALVRNKVEKGHIAIKELKTKHSDHKTNQKIIKEIDNIYNTWCRFFLWVNYDNQTIIGNFNQQDFRDAIFRYISENAKETLHVEMNKITREGYKQHKNSKEAINKLEDELFDRFYGN